MGQLNSDFGSKTWFIADGWMPSKTPRKAEDYEGHESIMLLNCQDQEAKVYLDLFFENNDPIKDILIIVPSNRVKCVRLDHPEEIGGVKIPRLTQYAMRLRSDIDVIVQYGRMDITQPNLAFMALMGTPA